MSTKKQITHLANKKRHTSALLSNLGKSLITHKKIITTQAKAKALQRFIEPLLTQTKTDTLHSRRKVFAHFQDKETVKELFNNIAHKIANRAGGYTRVIPIGSTRLGDGAPQALIELVDYNELLQKSEKRKTRRSRKKIGSKTETFKEDTPNTTPLKIDTKA